MVCDIISWNCWGRVGKSWLGRPHGARQEILPEVPFQAIIWIIFLGHLLEIFLTRNTEDWSTYSLSAQHTFCHRQPNWQLVPTPALENMSYTCPLDYTNCCSMAKGNLDTGNVWAKMKQWRSMLFSCFLDFCQYHGGGGSAGMTLGVWRTFLLFSSS